MVIARAAGVSNAGRRRRGACDIGSIEKIGNSDGSGGHRGITNHASRIAARSLQGAAVDTSRNGNGSQIHLSHANDTGGGEFTRYLCLIGKIANGKATLGH